MSEMINIEAKPHKRETMPVMLLGIEYTVVVPRAGVLISAMKGRKTKEPATDEEKAALVERTLGRIDQWIEVTFEDSADEIFDRLEDPADDLEYSHIQELQMALLEREAKKSGNPTSSQPGSRASRRSTGQTSKATRSRTTSSRSST